MTRSGSRAWETQTDHLQGSQEGVVVGRPKGSGRSSPRTCRRPWAHTGRPSRNASDLEQEGWTPSREKGGRPRPPPLPTPDAPCVQGAPSSLPLNYLSMISLQSSHSLSWCAYKKPEAI